MSHRTKRVFGVDCQFVSEGEIEVPAQIAVQLYRVAQEAVSNAVRHGNPQLIQMSLRREPDCLILDVADDGKGMAKTTGTSGLGLLTMAHRIQMMGGEFQIRTGAGKGTRIEGSVPYPYRTIEA